MSGASRAPSLSAARSAAGVFFPQLSTWVRQAALAMLFLVVLLVFNLWRGELVPGNSWSLWYGGIATFLMLVAALLSVRRRFQGAATRLGVGSARAWLDVHIAGGVTFVVLVLMHSGFRSPSSTSGWLLLGLSVWTVLTGFLGLAVQRWVPRVLASGLSVEVLFQRAPALVADLRTRGAELSARCGPPISTLYDGGVSERFERLEPKWSYLFDITGGRQSVLRGFEHLEHRLDEVGRESLHELERLLVTKLEIDASYTLQRVLRWWLWLHVPTSFLLLAVVALHIGTSLYY